MSTIAIKDATEEQLRQFAQSHLGISIPANAKAETVRAKVAAAWGKDEFPLSEPAPNQAQEGAPPPPVTASQMPPGKEKVKIIIQRTDDAGGDEPVPVGVNGRVMLIPRGEEVEIPMAYYEVLQNAVMSRYESLADGGINPVPRKVPLYPYQRVA